MIVGYARTIEMLCTARAVPAGEAKDYGLVLDVFPDEGFLDEVVQRAQYMATKGPIGLRGTKRVAKVRQAPGKADARLLSNKLRRELEFRRDVAEAIDAHKAGRSPVFLGSCRRRRRSAVPFPVIGGNTRSHRYPHSATAGRVSPARTA